MSATDRAKSEPTLGIVQRLVAASESDTVYADLYVSRARELLTKVLPLQQYRALQGIEREIQDTVKQTKQATMAQDWVRVERLAAQVDQLRKRAEENASAAEVGGKIYDAVKINIDPFSPGFESLPGFDPDLARKRNALVETLNELARTDPSTSAFYDSRREFFSALALASRGADEAAAVPKKRTAEIEQLAAQAAQRGDMAELKRCAAELARRAREEKEASSASTAQSAEVGRTTYRCPVDLSVPFADEQRARALGFAVARTEPIPEAAPVLDYVANHIWHANLVDPEGEREGIVRAQILVEDAGFPSEVTEPVKLLVSQWLQTPFINSGGARYLPTFGAEAVLIEDFPEDPGPLVETKLLGALHLTRRHGLARNEIAAALSQHGAGVLREHLGLDPTEFRLVCIPQDLYSRFGRDHGWGKQQRWTHFDGYQVFKNGALRALAGGDVRYGGLNDLVSISATDQRDSVIVRFAVVRRARQVARWR